MHADQTKVIIESEIFDSEHYLDQVKNCEFDLASEDIDRRDIESVINHYVNVGDAHRLSPSKLFDTHYYYEINRDVAESDMSALFHFLEYGWRELRNPHPLFNTQFATDQITSKSINPLVFYMQSPPGTIDPHPLVDENYVLHQFREIGIDVENVLISFLELNRDDINPSQAFDTRRYMTAYPDLRQASRTLNALYHYVRYGEKENRWIFDESASLVGIEEQMNRINHIEPNVVPLHTDLYDLPFSYSKTASNGLKPMLRQINALFAEPKPGIIYFVSDIDSQDIISTLEKLLDAQISSDTNAQPRIIITDCHSTQITDHVRRTFDVTAINIDKIADSVDTLHLDAVLRLLAMALATSQCQTIIFLNSRVGWDLCKHYGAVLSRHTQLHGFAAPYDHDQYGRRSGYAWTHLRDCLPFLASVIVDSVIMAQRLSEDLRLTGEEQEKFVTFQQLASSTRSQRRLTEDDVPTICTQPVDFVP
ncbi:hypothetical protein [Methylobacterium sp. GC_Met_2]|uniref:hypothetical protein n=1 Tax=Methylobacterium sp. GC_Met_2 TaxID=2937376 RepID=UPI00226B39BA|nr:hypothetical protein [Methylobacterium sp. GC_Met_2]